MRFVNQPLTDWEASYLNTSADRDLRRLRPFLGNVFAFTAREFDFEPASLVFFSSGTPPPVLKMLQTASNTVKQQRKGKQGKSVLFK